MGDRWIKGKEDLQIDREREQQYHIMKIKNVWITHRKITRLNYTVTQIYLCTWKHTWFLTFLILRETDNVREKEKKNVQEREG